MDVTIQFRSAMPDQPGYTEAVSVGPDTTLLDVLGMADVSSYYPLSGAFTWNTTSVPYLVSDGVLEYDVPYEKARVVDFLQTHNIEDGVISAEANIPQVGGAALLLLDQYWHMIEHIITFVGLARSACSDISRGVKWLKNWAQSENHPPQVQLDFIYSQKGWNHFDLAEFLKVDADTAESLLIGLGYQYDSREQRYLATDISREVHKKLSQVNVHDV